MNVALVELGIPYTGWPVRSDGNYEFGLTFLSSQLIDRISEWARGFSRGFNEEAGWSSEALREEHLAEGLRLRDVLQEALGESYRVELNDLGSGRVQV
ncbi:hypothetical protein [Microbacterium terregens]|jgi:hypothetical protein|uniref:Uncharacterized protein n=1 Tax=Microbacterium terregens TaxID=69363 RepID=A0ABV5SZ49_9MICO